MRFISRFSILFTNFLQKKMQKYGYNYFREIKNENERLQWGLNPQSFEPQSNDLTTTPWQLHMYWVKKLVYKCITVSVAQPARANPTLDSISLCQGHSESVVKVSGTPKFARLDFREQWGSCIVVLLMMLKTWKDFVL